MKHFCQVAISLYMFLSSAVIAEEIPKSFFKEYIRLVDAFDPALADLYNDGAQVLGYRVYPHGLERNMEFTGVQWKELLKRAMPLAKVQNDKSTFSNVKISESDGGFKIKADRYSVRKCYTDTGYYIIVKSDKNGQLAIFKEYMETRPLPNC